MSGEARNRKKPNLRSFFQGRSLYFKLLSYFVTLLIPIIVVGLITYIQSEKVIEESFSEKITSNVQTASDSIDLYIRIAQETSGNFFNDSVVRSILTPRGEQTPEIKTELWKIPKIIQRNENIVSGFAESMFVFVDNQDVYVSGGVNRFDSFFKNIYHYEKYDNQFWEDKLASSEYVELLPMSRVFEQNAANRKFVVPIVMHNQIGRHKAVMVLNINIGSIEKALKGNSVFNSTAFLVLDDKSNLVYDSHGFLDKMASQYHLNTYGEHQENSGEVIINGSKYIVSHVSSSLFGWQYYALTPTVELRGLTKGIMQMTFVLCIVLILMGIVFAFLFSSKIYNPIKSIRDFLVQKNDLWHSENETGKQNNEIETIQSGLRFLVDNHQQYKVKYDRYAGEYLEYSFLMLMKGHSIHDKDVLEETLKNEFQFTKKGFQCIGILFDFKEAFYQDIRDTDRLYVFSEIKKILWSTLNDYVPVYVMEYRKNIFVGVVNLDHPGETKLVSEGIEKVLSLFRNDENYCDIIAGTGCFFTDIGALNTSFNEVMTAISKRDRGKSFQIINSDDMSITDKFFYSLYDEQKLLNCLKAGDMYNLESVIDSILDKNVQMGVSYEHMMLLMKELHSSGVRFMADKGMDISGLETESDYFTELNRNRLESFVGTEEMRQKIKGFFHEMIGILGIQNNSKQGNLVSMITRYIEENYMKDLCLELIADQMGVSAKYVSRVFKENTGILLTDYINDIRINKAKELLKDTSLPIQDIAARIGIENRTTFLRVFKKVEGITPTVYRLFCNKTE